MKLVPLVLVSFALSLSAGFQASATSPADPAPAKGPVAFSKVYVAEGFDNNDNVQVVGVGHFNNSCYRNAETLVKVDHVAKTIRFAPLAYKYGGVCLQVIMPFDRVVDVGILKEGTYTLLQEGVPQPLAKLNIHATTHLEADDMLYAPISQAFFLAAPGSNRVTLTGEFPMSCMKIKEVKFNVQPEVLVVQPIAEIDKSVPCNNVSTPFMATTEVGPMKQGRYMMHIRSMNGKAVSSLIDVH